MNLYYFDPNEDGQNEYFIMSSSKENALAAIVGQFRNFMEKYPNSSACKLDYCTWKNATIDNLPYNYTISEHAENSVLVSTKS